MYDAVGIHVFAGGFTMGVKKVMNCETQLEKHGFGIETAEEVAKVQVINGEWPDVPAQMAFGNPRCTGFSTITSGYDETAHGPWSKQTCDIHELCSYAAGKYDIVIWESVQQAYTTGKPLLDYLISEYFAPRNYRVAHVFINAASFSNAQQRKRYFFVAYRDDRNFNITPPVIDPYYATLYDAIWEDRNRETREVRFSASDEYDRDCYIKLTDNEKACVPYLPTGWGLNTLARFRYQFLPDKMKYVWDTRVSDMPFSLHCISRTNWLRPCPTLHSSATRYIHPTHDRPLTVGELAAVMGWDDIPRGRMPVPQLAKGVVPAVGEWLAQQAADYLDGKWAGDDWESSYDPHDCEWKGRSVNGAREKVFDLTRYVGSQFDRSRYEVTDDELFDHRYGLGRDHSKPARRSLPT
jgi:site-specific DNA-cytosine methylase